MGKWTFVCVADMQPGSPKSFRYNPSWQKNWDGAKNQILEINPEIVIAAGDLTRDGSIHRFELEEMKKDLDSLPFPVHVVPGNMDTGNKFTSLDGNRNPGMRAPDTELNITSDKIRQFSEFFGPPWWSVEHREVRFSGFADVIINSGLPEEEEFWKWAEQQKKLPEAQHHIWMLHYALFRGDPEEKNWDIASPDEYTAWYDTIDQPGRGRLIELFKATGAGIVISGHVHCRKAFTFDNILFQLAPATSFPRRSWPGGDTSLGFLKYEVDGDAVNTTFVPLRKTYDLPGYGIGGHPPEHLRDYSIAWEKD